MLACKQYFRILERMAGKGGLLWFRRRFIRDSFVERLPMRWVSCRNEFSIELEKPNFFLYRQSWNERLDQRIGNGFYSARSKGNGNYEYLASRGKLLYQLNMNNAHQFKVYRVCSHRRDG